MSERLLEADFEFVDIKALIGGGGTATTRTPSTTRKSTKVKETLPAAGDWDGWGRLLKRRLELNNQARTKKQDYEVEQLFFEDFFKTNWGADLAPKLMDIGDPLRKLIKVLGFKAENSALIFMTLDFTKELLRNGKLNVLTFKAIYNTVAGRRIADSELRKPNRYNIIYCKDLYNKTPKEMEQYLKLQGTILKTSMSEYDESTQIKNKRTFCHFEAVNETEPSRYIAKVTRKPKVENGKKVGPVPRDELVVLTPITDLKLNSFKVAEAICGKKEEDKTVQVSNKDIAAITNKLMNVAQIYAALLLLSMNSDSTEARKAIALPYFKGLNAEEISTAVGVITKANILPKGHINTADADAFVNNLIAKLSKA